MKKGLKKGCLSRMKCYTAFVKHYKEEKGWTHERAERHWHMRKDDTDWPKGVDREDSQLTIYVPGEEYFD
eukprot:4949356-Alexandrium_andersonii.AAC.1